MAPDEVLSRAYNRAASKNGVHYINYLIQSMLRKCDFLQALIKTMNSIRTGLSRQITCLRTFVMTESLSCPTPADLYSSSCPAAWLANRGLTTKVEHKILFEVNFRKRCCAAGSAASPAGFTVHHRHLQTSATWRADGDATEAALNPLLQTPAPQGQASTSGRAPPGSSADRTAVATLRGIKIGPKKLNDFAAVFRRMHLADALTQCRISTKKASRICEKVQAFFLGTVRDMTEFKILANPAGAAVSPGKCGDQPQPERQQAQCWCVNHTSSLALSQKVPHPYTLCHAQTWRLWGRARMKNG